jgi:hypothetical protein
MQTLSKALARAFAIAAIAIAPLSYADTTPSPNANTPAATTQTQPAAAPALNMGPAVLTTEVCHGHGTMDNGQCHCEHGWSGYGCTVPDCNGHGSKDAKGRCVCEYPWKLPSCEVQGCTFVKYPGGSIGPGQFKCRPDYYCEPLPSGGNEGTCLAFPHPACKWQPHQDSCPYDEHCVVSLPRYAGKPGTCHQGDKFGGSGD